MPTSRLSTGVSLHYEWHGDVDGTPVIFIRGTGADSTRWMPQVEAYKDHYRCLTFDNRGSGKSDAPEGPYTVGMMAEDTLALMDVLEIPIAHLSGLSLGGAIAMVIAANHPERVSTLQLHGTWAKTNGYAAMSLGLLKRFLETGGIELYYQAALPMLFSPDYLTGHYDEVMATLRMMRENASSPVGLAGQLEANLTHDATHLLDRIQAPTLITVGQLDMCLPPSYSRALAAQIANSELVVFEGGSHLFGLQDSETFNQVTLDWLGRHATPVPAVL